MRAFAPRPLRPVIVVALALCGCGGGSSPPLDAGASVDAPEAAVDAPAVERDAPGGTDGGGSPCAYADTIDRTCTTDADCQVVLHQTDCCGSSAMLGIALSAYPVYTANEPACMASYPACGCPAMLPTTDSGETVTDTSAVRAACVSRGPRNVCLTYVTMRPLPGR